MGIVFGVVLCGTCSAAHYVPGLDGMDVAKYAAPGKLDLRVYATRYSTDDYRNNKRDQITGLSEDGDEKYRVDLLSYGASVKLAYMTNFKFFGANYGMQASASFSKNDFEDSFKCYSLNMNVGASDEEADWRDFSIAPVVLNWQRKNWNLAFTYEVFMPGSRTSVGELANPSFDSWSQMFSLTGSYRWNELWQVAGAVRIEDEFAEPDPQRDTYKEYGSDLALEVSISRRIGKRWRVGLNATALAQITEDQRSSDNGASEKLFGERYTVGPEVRYLLPDRKTELSLQWQHEFQCRNNYQGDMVVLGVRREF